MAVSLVPSYRRFAESVNAPPVVMYGTRPEVSDVTRRFVEVAVPKTVSPFVAPPPPIVEDAYAVREASPVMFCALPVTAPPKVNAGSVVVKLGTLEPLVTSMEEAARDAPESAPVAEVYGTLEGIAETVRFVVLAVPK